MGPMGKTIDRSVVERIAALARLELTAAEKSATEAQLSAILDYVRKLEELDVARVEPLAHALETPNVFREDEARPSMPTEDALANAPDKVEVFFKVPKVIEE